MPEFRIDRHLFALAPTAGDGTMRTYGWTAGIESGLSRLQDSVPWGWATTTDADPPRLTGNRRVVFDGAHLDRLSFAMFAFEGRLAFSLWGALGTARNARQIWRPATHTVLLDDDAFDAIAGNPFALYALEPGLGADTAWLDELTAERSFEAPVSMEPVRVSPTPALARFAEGHRIRAVTRLRDRLASSLGAEGTEAALGGLHTALERAIAADRTVALRGVPGSTEELLLRLAWLSMPLEDRRRTLVSSAYDDAGLSRVPLHLIAWSPERWHRSPPNADVFDPTATIDPTTIALGHRYWARLVRTADPDAGPGTFAQRLADESAVAATRRLRLIGTSDISQLVIHEQWRVVVEREDVDPRSRAEEFLQNVARARQHEIPVDERIGALFGRALRGRFDQDTPDERAETAIALVAQYAPDSAAPIVAGAFQALRDPAAARGDLALADAVLVDAIRRWPTLDVADPLIALDGAIAAGAWRGRTDRCIDLVHVLGRRLERGGKTPSGMLAHVLADLPRGQQASVVGALIVSVERLLQQGQDVAALREQLEDPALLRVVLRLVRAADDRDAIAILAPTPRLLVDAVLTLGDPQPAAWLARTIVQYLAVAPAAQLAEVIAMMAAHGDRAFAFRWLSHPAWTAGEHATDAYQAACLTLDAIGPGTRAAVDLSLGALRAHQAEIRGDAPASAELVYRLLALLTEVRALASVFEGQATSLVARLSPAQLAALAEHVARVDDPDDVHLARALVRRTLRGTPVPDAAIAIGHLHRRQPLHIQQAVWVDMLSEVDALQLEIWIARALTELDGATQAPSLLASLARRLLESAPPRSPNGEQWATLPFLNSRRRDALLRLAFAAPRQVLVEMARLGHVPELSCLLQLFAAEMPLTLHGDVHARIETLLDGLAPDPGLTWAALGINQMALVRVSPYLARRTEALITAGIALTTARGRRPSGRRRDRKR